MNKKFFKKKRIWQTDERYKNYRIPGMIVTDKGTLLIYCEARCDFGDYALMDVILMRSEDNGKTFGEPCKLAEGNEQHNTTNNPVMMQDKNGRIHFLYCEDYTINGGRVLRRYSDDDGLTWSDAIDITEFTHPEYHNAFALGPGHGILTKDGTILVPVWMVKKECAAPIGAHSPSVISTFYSTDCGETWRIGEILDANADVMSPNETVAAPTSDGRVYLNIRHQASCRAKAYSKTGYSEWEEYAPERQLPDPQCFGSVTAYNDGEHPYMLIFGNCADKENRTHVTIYASTDDGKTYPISRLLDEYNGGYVEVAVDDRRKLIYVLYENNFGMEDYLVIFNYNWLTEENGT